MHRSSTSESSCSTASGHYLMVADGCDSSLPLNSTFTLHTVSGSFDISRSSTLRLPSSSGYVLYEEEDSLEASPTSRKVFHMAADGRGHSQKLVDVDTQYRFEQQREVLIGDERSFYGVASFEGEQPLHQCVAMDDKFAISDNSEMNEGLVEHAQVSYVFETSDTTMDTNSLESPLCDDIVNDASNIQREAKTKTSAETHVIRLRDSIREDEEEERLTLPSPAMLNDMMSKVQSRCLFICFYSFLNANHSSSSLIVVTLWYDGR